MFPHLFALNCLRRNTSDTYNMEPDTYYMEPRQPVPSGKTTPKQIKHQQYSFYSQNKFFEAIFKQNKKHHLASKANIPFSNRN